MAITYEEALETLQAMFSEPWTRDTLDAVLRHQKGHMENTVDFILRHSDKDPQTLVDQLKAGGNPDLANTSLDAALARQLSQRQRPLAAVSTSGRRGSGLPTVLPNDFLRISGRASSSTTAAASAPETTMSTLESDAALARMLQDELFSEELARNPDFAHLARGRPRTVGGMPTRSASGRQISAPPPPAAGGVPNSPNIVHKITELGDNARKKLQLLAAQFNARHNLPNPFGNKNNDGNAAAAGAGGTQQGQAERRGLLDDHDYDDLELAARKEL